MTDLTMRPATPQYTVEYQADMELWVVKEDEYVLAYCPEQGSALLIAQACSTHRAHVIAYAGAHQAAAGRERLLGLN